MWLIRKKLTYHHLLLNKVKKGWILSTKDLQSQRRNELVILQRRQQGQLLQASGAQHLLVNKLLWWQGLIREKYHTWSMELLLRFGVNNNYVIFQTPIVPTINVYRKHLAADRKLKKFNKKHHSTMMFGFTTGRCGFVRNQKRTFLAIDITLRAALWFVKRLHKFLFYGIKIRFMGHSRYIKRHLKYFRRFYLGNKLVKVHSIIDATPVPHNGVRQKAVGRKRYRHHRYTYRRFFKMTKLLQYRRRRVMNLF